MISKIRAILLLYLILFSTSLVAKEYNSLEINPGYRNGHYHRHLVYKNLISGKTNVVNVDFRNLSYITLAIKDKLILTEHFYFRSQGEYGWMVHGNTPRKTTDPLFQAALNHTYYNKGHIAYLEGAFGYTFFPSHWKIAPVIGLGYDKQKMQALLHKKLSFSKDITWLGPFAGIDIAYHPFEHFFFVGTYEFHYVKHHNHHIDLPIGIASVDIKHKHNIGNTFTISSNYTPNVHWYFGLLFGMEFYRTLGKPSMVLVTTGPSSVKLNRESDYWHSWNLQFKIGYGF